MMAPTIFKLGHLVLDSESKTIAIHHVESAVKPMEITVGSSVGDKFHLVEQTENKFVISWPSTGSTLTVSQEMCNSTFDHVVETGGDSLLKYTINWTTTSMHYLKDIVQLKTGGHWYGGPELYSQDWPITNDNYAMSAYVPGDLSAVQGSGMERLWFCSNKCAIFVPKEVPLLVAHQFHQLSLQAQIQDFVYANFYPEGQKPTLQYSIITPSTGHVALQQFHVNLIRHLYEKPTSSPDERMIKEPIWTTWVRYGKQIDQEKVMEFAKEIKNHGFSIISQLELDDEWAPKYGDFVFDTVKFPDIKKMCKELTDIGIRLTLWMHPFINLDSENGKDARLHKYYVQESHSPSKPCIVQWWNGKAAYCVDFTNPQAADWFLGQLRQLQALGVHSFKFDAGEVSYFPQKYVLNTGKSPTEFSRAYVETVTRLGNDIEIRVFNETQRHGVFIRTLDRDSCWGMASGLATLLPICLNFSVLGYPYNLPDIVGGNAYSSPKPNKELFTRWVQVNVFLLAYQFSFAPWDYDAETVAICQKMLKLRKQWSSYLVEESKKCCTTGLPVIRPLWWLGDHEDFLTCKDQLLVGEKVMVAPVFEDNARERRVLIPQGKWQSEIDGIHHNGPTVITQKVNLDELAYYVKQ